MTTLWRKTFSPFLRQSVFTDRRSPPSSRPESLLMSSSISITMSASKVKQEWRRLRCATPLKTQYFLPWGSFLCCPHNLGRCTPEVARQSTHLSGQSPHSDRKRIPLLTACRNTCPFYFTQRRFICNKHNIRVEL